MNPERVRELLNYDPATGMFWWRLANSPRIKVGDVAGSQWAGYHVIQLDGRKYGAHRLAWAHVTGLWATDRIDHINCNGCDNRFANLRLATHSQNLANQRRPRTNTSGFKGVHWAAHRKKWRAAIGYQNRVIHIGLFECIEDAAVAYRKKAVELFGEFARNE